MTQLLNHLGPTVTPRRGQRGVPLLHSCVRCHWSKMTSYYFFTESTCNFPRCDVIRATYNNYPHVRAE